MMKKHRALDVQNKTSNLTNELKNLNQLIEEIDNLYANGKYEEVICRCDEAMVIYPNKKTNFLYNKAVSLQNINNVDQASACINEILSIDPKHIGARAWLAGNEFDKLFNEESKEISPNLLEKLKQYAMEIGKNKELVNSINEISESLGTYSKATESALTIKEKFKEQEEKKEKDSNYEIDFSEIKACFQVVESYKDDDSSKSLEKRARDLRADYTEEYTKFSKLFSFLSRLEKVQSKYEPVLKEICSIIGIKYDALTFYYKMFDTIENENDEKDNYFKDANDSANNYPQFEKSTFDRSTKSLGQILDELVLDMKNDVNMKTTLTSEEIKKYLDLEEKDFQSALSLYKSKFNSMTKIINGYEKVYEYSLDWENKNANDIKNWAQQIKGNLNNVHEAIAVMDRANAIITGGHRLRHPQLVSLLIYLENEGDEGKLLQIGTGEGKTLIVSLFVAIIVLKGETVDVITSNNVLAEEGVKERRTFYNMLGLSVTTNNPEGSPDKSLNKNSYKADIVYGSISNFQFDFLRDSFEGWGTRANREFGTVMIDEIDSMLIDNGGHIAKLSGPLPGMESLRPIYIEIWMAIATAEKSHENDFQSQMQSIKQQYEMQKIKISDISAEHHKVLKSFTDRIKEQVRGSINIKDNKLIPTHLIDYANRKLHLWIDNAIYAKYYCEENKNYLIKKLNDEDVIVPIDYENTGVTLKNTIWSNGLHQFVQLKHNLYLTCESLTSSFISNIGYIKKHKKIFGLTGTLGSVCEHELLSSVYKVNFAKVPTYKSKNFKEIDLLTVNEFELYMRVAVEAADMCDNRRAVLIICETISDLKNVQKELKNLQELDGNVKYQIKTFSDESNSKITEDKLKPGDIVISTNIGGRGTDFKTTKEVEANGGLHVIVTFLPCNKRVEDQAFGRTSRQGKSGSAQIIMPGNELFNRYGGSKILKDMRDEVEKARINEMKNVKLAEINFHDEIFSLFSDVYVKLYKKHKNDEEYPYFLDDLKEFWAFWLDKNGNKGKKIEDAQSDFQRFMYEADGIINGKMVKHNPYYCIKQANSLIDNDKLDKAFEILEKNCLTIGNSAEILYPAYIKLFEISIENGHQLKERFAKALASVIFISYEKNETYKETASKYLNKAISALENESNFYESLFKQKEFGLILVKEETSEEDNSKTAKENYFLKHIKSRFSCLNTYLNNLVELKKEIQTTEGIAIDKKVPNLLKKSEDKVILETEVNEIDFLGLNEIYSIKKVYDVEPKVIARAQAQIAGGIVTLALGIAFPPALPVCGPIAGALISEGVTDIVLELISQGDTEFSEKEYAKSKCISYGISLATMGISAISSALKILAKAAKACRALSKAFAKSPFLKIIFSKVAEKLTKLASYFEKLHFEKIQKSFSSIQTVSRKEMLKATLKEIAIDTGKSVVSGVIDEKVSKPAIEKLLESLKPQIREKIQTKLQNDKELNEKLQKNKQDIINNKTKEILEGDTAEHIIDIAKEISLGVLQSSRHGMLKGAGLLLDTFITIDKINEYGDKFCKKMNESLNNDNKIINDNNKLEEIINNLSEQLTEKLFSFIIELANKFASTIIKDPILNKLTDLCVQKDKGDKNELIKTDANEIDSSKNERYMENLRLLGLSHGASESDIKKAFRMILLKTHTDKGGHGGDMDRLKMARDELLQSSKRQNNQQNSASNHSNEENNTNRNPSDSHNDNNQHGNEHFVKMIVSGNSDLNDCGQIALSKMFDVDKHELSKKTGVYNTDKGSNLADHELQFKKLDLQPDKLDFSNLTISDVNEFLTKNNASKAMLFLNKQGGSDDELGHVVLIGKESNKLVVYDKDNKFPIESVLHLNGTILTAKDLDMHVTRIQKDINENQEPHESVFNMKFTGNEDDEAYGFPWKDFSKLDIRTNLDESIFLESALTCSYIKKKATVDKTIRFNFDRENLITIRENGWYKASYCPFIKNTYNFDLLKRTEVTLKKSLNPWNKHPDCMLTGGTMNSAFSLSSYLICVGETDIKVYCDSNPTVETYEKIEAIQREEQRTIYRLDHVANQNLNLPSHCNFTYGELVHDAYTFTNAAILLQYNSSRKRWELLVQNRIYDIKTGVESKNGDFKLHEICNDVLSDVPTIPMTPRNLNKIKPFKQNPTEFLHNNYIKQFYPKQTDDMFKYFTDAMSHKTLSFDVHPLNIVNGRTNFSIDPHEDGEFKAHFSPYLANTSDWNELKKTEALVKLREPDCNYVLTGNFSGCAFIIAVGENDMKIYHDSAVLINISDKMREIASENRKIIRIDHLEKKDELVETIGTSCVQRYYGIENKSKIQGHVMMYYSKGEWIVSITTYESLSKALNAPFDPMPIHNERIPLSILYNEITNVDRL